jgi:hypothetical protein
MKNAPLPITIKLQPEHIDTLIKALETYSRLRSGQIDMALDQAFWDKPNTWAEKKEINALVRDKMFAGEPLQTHPNMGYGIGDPRLKDGTLAYEIKKTLEHYLHFQRHNGYCQPMQTDAYPPLNYTDIPLPEILGFKTEKRFSIPKKYQEKINRLIEEKNYAETWEKIKNIFKRKPLPRGKAQRLEKVDDQWVLVIEYPQLPSATTL